METTNSDFKLWSPPLLDLSLDSFSNDLFQEFDKTRLNVQDSNNNAAQVPAASSPISSSSATLPSPSKEASIQQQQQPQQPQMEEEESEDTSSAANLFRKSSTFLKKKLSTNSSQRNSAISTATTNNADDISSIVSRQYPPKPLQYSPIIEPPSDKVSRNSRDSANVLTITEEIPEQEEASQEDASMSRNDEAELKTVARSPTPPSPSAIYTTASPPMVAITAPLERSITSNQTAASVSNTTSHAAVKPSTPTATATTPTTASHTPKRRSFFSLRFC
ncbi:hypothetical protein HMPREF1544_10662 [Mucor circinelloides 1006PhL]|uniref:Uncharacterized protein n=1 Tax=Mucor circinelloides f. circinelloides (strain 1006PhL) TaxID=1220926 RepID=S2JJ65_MUCC1|nr:hypothetical protein HMPREF1544_10662 [Mucor circinelloides 1006PhL]